MATFTASAAQANVPAFYNVNGSIERIVRFVPSAAASAGDVLQMVKVPSGAVVAAVNASVSFSAGVVTANIGDGNDTSRYGAAVVFSGSVVALTSMPHRGLGYSYSAEDTIDIVVAAVSAPPGSAVYVLRVSYTCQNEGQG